MATATKGNRVAGQVEPRRHTIFRQAYQAFRARASKAWRLGFGRYLSLLTPLRKTVLDFRRRTWHTISSLASKISSAVRKWRERRSRVMEWTRNGRGGVLRWMRNEWEDQKTILHAKRTRQKITLDRLVEAGHSKRSCLVWLLSRGMAVGFVVWAGIHWFQPLSDRIGPFFAVVVFVVGALIVWDLSVLLTFVLIFLGLPLVGLLGTLGFVGLAVVSLLYLLATAGILLATVLVSLVGGVILLASLAALAVVATVLFVPIAIGSVGFGLYLLGLVVLQCTAILAITSLRPGQYLWVLRRGIRYMCPNGRHGTFAIPAHICPDCGSAYSKLWPSTYGVFRHRCEGIRDGRPCHRLLPTLDALGRNQLNRVCATCGVPFVSRSSGKLPVTVVGIVGGTSVGKTTMMLMAIQQLMLMSRSRDQDASTSAEIDTSDQRVIFDREWRRLEKGMTVAPTSGSVPEAFILRLKHHQRETLLYLYDAPGEQYSSIEFFSQHQWLQSADGLMLLVDPTSLPGFAADAGQPAPEDQASKTPLSDVTGSCIAAAQKMKPQGSDERLAVPLAVVITKADVMGVRRRLGDAGRVDSKQCVDALQKWKGDSPRQTIERYFSEVCYFACSALGRSPDGSNSAAFTPQGVLDPLIWILDKADRRR